jgi:hypothetical protein
MAPYRYLPLADGSEDIRLITLLPGKFDDDIRLKIFHVPLKQPVQPTQQKMTLKKLKKVVPPHCQVFENLEGRFIFRQQDEDGSWTTSWTHPDPNFDGQLYLSPREKSAPRLEPSFEALSYCWGSAVRTDSVYVERKQLLPSVKELDMKFDEISITQSLYQALKHLRLRDDTRMLWADAICIDQRNEAERSAQVMRMQDIYKLARRVVIWLGPASKSSKLAFETLEYLGDQIEYTKDDYIMESPNTTEQSWFHPSTVLPYTAEQWDAICDLMARHWFSRLWVCQEAQFANSRAIIQCGMYECLWSRFRRAARVIRAKQQPLSMDLRERVELINPLVRYLEQPLLDVLSMSRTRQCSDERDRVYGLLGLMPSVFARDIPPDYTLSVSTVMKDLLLTYLHQTSRLDMLAFCGPLSRHIDCPTWVPRLVESGYIPYFPRNGQFSAGHSRAQWAHYLPHALSVTGIQCATISAVSTSGPVDLVERLKVVRTWEPADLLSKPYVTGGLLYDAYASTLMTGVLQERWESRPICTLQQCKDMVSTRLCQSGDLYNDPDVCENVIYNALMHSRGRSLLTTKEGHIGLGPRTTQPGTIQFESLF